MAAPERQSHLAIEKLSQQALLGAWLLILWGMLTR
jgi:hypothetical protein